MLSLCLALSSSLPWRHVRVAYEWYCCQGSQLPDYNTLCARRAAFNGQSNTRTHTYLPQGVPGRNPPMGIWRRLSGENASAPPHALADTCQWQNTNQPRPLKEVYTLAVSRFRTILYRILCQRWRAQLVVNELNGPVARSLHSLQRSPRTAPEAPAARPCRRGELMLSAAALNAVSLKSVHKETRSKEVCLCSCSTIMRAEGGGGVNSLITPHGTICSSVIFIDCGRISTRIVVYRHWGDLAVDFLNNIILNGHKDV